MATISLLEVFIGVTERVQAVMIYSKVDIIKLCT